MVEERNNIDIILQRLWWISGMIVGICGIVLTIYQVIINDKLVKETRLSNQPVFQVNFDYWQSDTSYIYDHVDFRVDSKGIEPRNIETPELYTYVQFYYSESYRENLKKFYIPIEYYFGWVLPTHNLTGKVAFTYTPTPNNAYFNQLYAESRTYSQQEHVNAFVSMVHVTKINYTDKYNEEHTIYFKNEENVEEQEVKDILEQSKKQFGYEKWHIEDLSILKLKEICGISDNN